VVDDPEDLDEAEGGSQPPQGHLLVGVDLAYGPSRLPPLWLVASGSEVQVDPAALELQLVDLALAVVLAAGLKGEHLEVAGQVLELSKQFSYRHPTQRSVLSAVCGLDLGDAARSARPSAMGRSDSFAAGSGGRRSRRVGDEVVADAGQTPPLVGVASAVTGPHDDRGGSDPGGRSGVA
jgi:hypothetical protein